MSETSVQDSTGSDVENTIVGLGDGQLVGLVVGEFVGFHVGELDGLLEGDGVSAMQNPQLTGHFSRMSFAIDNCKVSSLVGVAWP